MKLREARLEKQMTIRKLSELSGVSIAHISEIENEKHYPSILILCRLAKALGVKPDKLYTYFF